jgi:hypothetical protein
LVIAAAVAGCASPLSPYSPDTPPLVRAPVTLAGVVDERGRFREIFCEVLEAQGPLMPDYRPCEEALTRLGSEPAGDGRPVALGPSRKQLQVLFVPGIGWDCFEDWLEPPGTVGEHLRRFGFDFDAIAVDSLSSSAANARQIRDALLAKPQDPDDPRIVLVGYSKGAPDILQAVATYPEIRSRVAAVVSIGGAVGGSPLANDAEQSDLAPLRRWPGARCTQGDGGGVASLRPDARASWLAQNPLPEEVRYYSLVTLPAPDNISTALQHSYDKLTQIDGRNDSQVLFYDQVIPAGALLGYLNADHWAAALPLGRSHTVLAATLIDHNAYPREALLEAVLRFIEEDLVAP